MSDDAEQKADRIVTIGCVAVLVTLVAACMVSSIFRPSDISAMRACADACGPGRMSRYSATACECEEPP